MTIGYAKERFRLGHRYAGEEVTEVVEYGKEPRDRGCEGRDGRDDRAEVLRSERLPSEVPAGCDWQGLSSELQLTGWSRKRRVIVLRRPIRESLAIATDNHGSGQGELFGAVEVLRAGELYEYAVLITPPEEEVLGIAQLYRDAAARSRPSHQQSRASGARGFRKSL
ncbi:MAG: hypothetical protein M3Y07_07505 [Acidobacteriota bacterium]|nr:hypothetical protein [Acidobacteriota bacterium]